MKVSVLGLGYLAETHAAVVLLRGFELVPEAGDADFILVAEDVVDHANLDPALRQMIAALRDRPPEPPAPVVLLSQVPPGTTRRCAGKHRDVFYQVDTIIVRDALRRTLYPEQIIVGCADPRDPLPLEYQEYLLAHDCPVHQMSYESAELAKCMINYALAKQIELANEGALAADRVGADWDEVARALAGDARIGPHAYLRPGRTNRHLDRDVDSVKRILSGSGGE